MYHIVRMNEKLEQIALTYNLSVEEIKSNNQHIRDWGKLVAGTKLILPAIPSALRDELNDVEPFIEDYYPKLINPSEYQNINDEETKVEVNNENNEVEETSSKPVSTIQKKTNPSKTPTYYKGYYPHASYLYPYYYPYAIRKTKHNHK